MYSRKISIKVYLVLPFSLALICFLLLLETTNIHAQQTPGPYCRLGVNLNTLRPGPVSAIDSYDIASLGAGWYINYQATVAPVRPNGIEMAQVVRIKPQQIGNTSEFTYALSHSASAIQQIAAANPHAIWFAGNEPDRIKAQDGILPDLYAAGYHRLYHLVKDADPTARIYPGSIVQPTEVRLEYLDAVLAAYEAKYHVRLPVTGWSIHNFILNEASCEHYNDLNICWGAEMPPGSTKTDGLRITTNDNDNFDLFKVQIERFRQWMADNGYRGLPLLLSEYGVLMPESFGYPPARVNQFMTRTFEYAEKTRDGLLGDPNDGFRLIQRVSWYSVNDDNPYNGYLFRPSDFKRSAMGDNYAAFAVAMTPEVDLYPTTLDYTFTPSSTNGTADIIMGDTVTLTARIANSGNLLQLQPAMVRFYDGNPQQRRVQIGTDQLINLAGCGETTEVAVSWSNFEGGLQKVFVEVDVMDAITETNELNNVVGQELLFSTRENIYLPIIRTQLENQRYFVR